MTLVQSTVLAIYIICAILPGYVAYRVAHAVHHDAPPGHPIWRRQLETFAAGGMTFLICAYLGFFISVYASIFGCAFASEPCDTVFETSTGF